MSYRYKLIKDSKYILSVCQTVVSVSVCTVCNGGVRNFHLGGYSPGGLGVGSHPVGPRAEAPVGDLGTPPEAGAVSIQCLQTYRRNDRNLKILHNINPLILDQYVSRWGWG